MAEGLPARDCRQTLSSTSKKQLPSPATLNMIHNGSSSALLARSDIGDRLMPRALYMVVEHFKNGDAVAVYRRFRDKGRMMPEGLRYVSS
ncbi:MAG: DUF3303 domain-containing protein, partial [Bryobacteraceae bacterium]